MWQVSTLISSAGAAASHTEVAVNHMIITHSVADGDDTKAILYNALCQVQ